MKNWLIAALCLIVAGALLFTVPLAISGWDFGIFDSTDFQTEEHTVSEDFDNISIESGTADIVFSPSEDGICKVVCIDDVKFSYRVEVNNGTLEITLDKTQKEWYEYISIVNYNSPKITIYLPKAEYSELFIDATTGDVKLPQNFSFENVDITLSTGDAKVLASATKEIKIHVSTGMITLENVTAETVSLSVSTGNTSVKNVTCTDFDSKGTTGELVLKDLIATNKITAERNTGDVSFESCDAADIFVETSTGEVTGTLLSGKDFYVTTSTGDVNVPASSSGGICKITTSTGDVNISCN